MDTLSYKTISAKKETVTREWYVVDATGMVVGRLASEIAKVLRGKHKPSYTPHVDCGDNIIIINADKVRFTGNKMQNKVYLRHTGYPGGQRKRTPAELLVKNPTGILESAIRGMLPKNTLGRDMFRKLYVYAGDTHKHEAQQPKPLTFNI